jgi:hypothetical protein
MHDRRRRRRSPLSRSGAHRCRIAAMKLFAAPILTVGAIASTRQAAEYEIANIVDPDFTVVAQIAKMVLGRR